MIAVILVAQGGFLGSEVFFKLRPLGTTVRSYILEWHNADGDPLSTVLLRVVDSSSEWFLCTDQGYVKRFDVSSKIFVVFFIYLFI